MFLHCLFTPSIYTDGLYCSGSRCEAGFLCEELCRCFQQALSGSQASTSMWRLCQTSIHPIIAQQRCSTYISMLTVFTLPSHFPQFFFTHVTIQPKTRKAASKINPLSKIILAFSNTASWMLPPPPRHWIHGGRMTFLFTRTHVNICSLQHGCRSVKRKKSGHLVTMSRDYCRKYQYPSMSVGWFFSKPRWARGKSQGTKCHCCITNCEVLLIIGRVTGLKAGNICEEISLKLSKS